jgi:aspartate aminotransferase
MVDSVSKRYSLCGARLGSIVTRNRQAYDLMLKFAQARLSAATPEQKAAVALGNVPDAYIGGIIREYQKRRDIVYEGIRAIPGALCAKPEGAFYVVVTLPVRDAEDSWFMLRVPARRPHGHAGPGGGYATPGSAATRCASPTS